MALRNRRTARKKFHRGMSGRKRHRQATVVYRYGGDVLHVTRRLARLGHARRYFLKAGK